MDLETETSESQTSFNVFDSKMDVAQIAALEEDWKAFKNFFEKNEKALLEPMDLNQNTAFHVATRSNKPQLLAELLDMLPAVTDRWRALRLKNARNNTILHNAVFYSNNVEIVNLLLSRYEKEVPPPDEQIGELLLKEKQLSLLEMKNDLGETPFYLAAKEGNLKMLQHLAKFMPNLQSHFRRDSDNTPILHIAIIGQHFDVAVWLMKVDDKLAYEKDERGLTSLQLLSNMPSVFRSGSHLGTAKTIIYNWLAEESYEDYDESIKDIKDGKDLESGKNKKRPPTSGFSRIINYAIWKFLAREWNSIDHFLGIKKQHKLAEKLAEMLVEKDESWHITSNAKQRTMVVLPVINPSNVDARKRQLNEMKREMQHTKTKGHYHTYTPLLLAASTGIVEIVEKIIEKYPEAINHVSEDEANILHIAVRSRQRNIYRIIKRNGALRWLAGRISIKGCLLHQVARMEYYKGGHQAGYAYELQDELRWYERVRKIMPHSLEMHCNNENLTAREQFETEHAEMLQRAQEWIKETSQSCSAVAVLVATVVFTAAYTLPGGTDSNGVPIFLHSPVFLFFTIMDVVALASSLASVVMFLSILTSPFGIWEFHKSLPRKLTLGFTLLFFSLTTTMLSFSATILLTIRLESKSWSSSLIYSAAFFPVSIFALLQFPFYMAVKTRFMQFCKKIKKLLPKCLVKSTAKSKKRKYRDFEQRGF